MATFHLKIQLGHVYADPADFLTLIARDSEHRHNPHAVHVYTDGKTGEDVREQVACSASDCEALIRERSGSDRRSAALEQVRALVAEFGLSPAEVAA